MSRPAKRRAVGAFLLAVALVATAQAAGGQRGASQETSAGVPLRLLVGQTILARLPGRVPTRAFLGRVARGEIGGVVLFADNFGEEGPGALVAQLQAAARRGGHLPLLIAIDQEGGPVRRLSGAPTIAPAAMTSSGVARDQGLATAQNLARYGINVDLAPVLDVGHGGFITSRTFGATPGAVTARGVAFARGLLDGHVLASAKHFPGLGYASTTTDAFSVVVDASRDKLMADLAPFRAAVAAGVPIVMLSTATYPALNVRIPAALTRTVIQGLLRDDLGFNGVVITDALSTRAVTRFESVPEAAVRSIRSGADMVIIASDTRAGVPQLSDETYAQILAAAKAGTLPRRTLELAYERVRRLKETLPAAGHP